MSRDHKEDFSAGGLEYMLLSLIPNKTKVLVIGGGRAGFIKARSFARHGCQVSVIAQEFSEAFANLTFENIQIIQASYKTEYMIDKHIVVIAVAHDASIEMIKGDCETYSKLYLCCKEPKEGQFILPASGETEQALLAVHTKLGSPSTATFLRDRLLKELKAYDDFIEYACSLRKRLKGHDKLSEIMSFVNTEDFLTFFNKGQHDRILKLFYGGIDFEH